MRNHDENFFEVWPPESVWCDGNRITLTSTFYHEMVAGEKLNLKNVQQTGLTSVAICLPRSCAVWQSRIQSVHLEQNAIY